MEVKESLVFEKYKDHIIDWVSEIAKAVNKLYDRNVKSENSTIKFLKTREVKSPTRAFETDAGIDFYVPEFTPEFVKILKEKNPDIEISDFNIILRSGQRVLIPSGIHCQMENHDRALIAANKSGIASKYGLIFGAQLVDYQYSGEIHLNLIYTGGGMCEIIPGMKILQFIETPIYCSKILIEENKAINEFYEKETKRGARGFGSSDN